jgi:hypothetical protein
LTNAAATFPAGPAIGAILPDFTLPDQHGTPHNFTAARRRTRDAGGPSQGIVCMLG